MRRVNFVSSFVLHVKLYQVKEKINEDDGVICDNLCYPGSDSYSRKTGGEESQHIAVSSYKPGKISPWI